jgi:hypothetical protein
MSATPCGVSDGCGTPVVDVGRGVRVAVGRGVLVAVAVGSDRVAVGRGVLVAVAVGRGVLVTVAVGSGCVAVGRGVLVACGSVTVGFKTFISVGTGVSEGNRVFVAVGSGVSLGATRVTVGGTGVPVTVARRPTTVGVAWGTTVEALLRRYSKTRMISAATTMARIKRPLFVRPPPADSGEDAP